MSNGYLLVHMPSDMHARHGWDPSLLCRPCRFDCTVLAMMSHMVSSQPSQHRINLINPMQIMQLGEESLAANLDCI